MASVHDNWRATNDSLEDVEPSVITITKGGVDHTVSAYMKLVDRDAYTHRIKYVTTTARWRQANCPCHSAGYPR